MILLRCMLGSVSLPQQFWLFLNLYRLSPKLDEVGERVAAKLKQLLPDPPR
jgi:hypothetical protein